MMSPAKLEYQRKYRTRNRDRTTAYARKRYADNPERARASSRKWYAANKETAKKWRVDNPERAREIARRWRTANPEHRWEHHLKTKYGMNKTAYDALLVRQGNGCAICGSATPNRSMTKRFLVDHDHVTGAVRGLLCHPCNAAIGLLRDRPGVARTLATYLERS